MVRVLVEQKYQEGKVYVECAGLSTDAKPNRVNDSDIITGSLFIEVDTHGTAFMFNETASEWVKVGD